MLQFISLYVYILVLARMGVQAICLHYSELYYYKDYLVLISIFC